MTPSSYSLRRGRWLKIYGLCRHCKREPSSYGRRGLCRRCFNKREVREEYPACLGGRPPAEESAGEKMAKAKEVKRMAACGENELPCGYCPAIVKVTAEHKAQVLRLGCDSTLCQACAASVAGK